MKLLTELNSLDNVKDGETRKLITKTTSSGSGNVVSSVSVSGDTITYTKGVTAVADANYVHTDNNFTTTLKNKLDGIASGAEVNQNAFSNVKVGSTTIAADSKTDTLELAAGSNITLTPDATNDKVTIAATQPTVNNGTLTIQKNGTNVQTFTANQSSNVTANITVPTKTSEITNDSGFITNSTDITGNAKTATNLKPVCAVGSDTANTNGWYKVASSTMSGYGNQNIFYYIKGGYTDGYAGLLELEMRTDNTSIQCWKCQWIARHPNLSEGNVKIVIENMTWTLYAYQPSTRYGRLYFIEMSHRSINGANPTSSITYYDGNNTPEATVPEATVTSTDGFAVLRAKQDGDGNTISSTYYKANNPNGYTSNTGTITKVQANGTDVASSGTANIPAATTSKYGVTKLSSATNSTSEALAATPKAVKAAYDLAASKGTGTITKVQANGTDVASSGTANIPAASTGVYGVTKLSDATNSTSTALAATANAVKKAYDLANTANTGLTNKLDTYNGEVEAPAEGTINWHNGTLEASSYDNFNNNAQFQLYKNQVELLVHSEEDGDSKLQLKPGTSIDLIQQDADNIYSSGLSLKNDEAWLSTNDNDRERSTYIQIKEADRSIKLYGGNIKVSQAPTTDLGIANKKYVDDSIAALPEPMVFKGSLGTGGTITSLPTAAATNEGHTYKVITAGTYASQAAKAGDTFICAKTGTNTYVWTLIPSGDEPSGTVTSVTLKATSPIAIDSSSAITTSGTRTLSHANSGVTAGTYRSVTVNATGHVTAGTNPTTLSGYGITDAKIANGVITLGSNTITPLTAHQDISGKYDKSGGAITGAITRSLASSGTIAATNLFTVTGSTDGFKVDYAATTADKGVTTLYTTDDADAKISIGNTVSSTYKEAISVTNGSATINGYVPAAACAKAVVTSIDTSASLPTSNAVKTFVEGKGYTTNTGTITGIKMNGASKGTSGVVDLGTVITSHQDISGKVNKSGDTMTGALNFANNVANKVGDDVSIGDFNKGGLLGIMGQNGTTGIALIKNGSTWSASAERAEMTYNSTDKCIEFIFS